MTNPWDIPPFPASGDHPASLTYEAVGRALSAWEEIEVSLSHLYGLFSGKNPRTIETYTEYGGETNFAQRSDKLSATALRYFVRRPHQELEAEFDGLIREIRCFSARRNDIAHGIVRAVRVRPSSDPPPKPIPGALLTIRTQYEFCLAPPTYTDRKFDADHTPLYLLTSVEISAFERHFRRSKVRSEKLFRRLFSRQPS